MLRYHCRGKSSTIPRTTTSIDVPRAHTRRRKRYHGLVPRRFRLRRTSTSAHTTTSPAGKGSILRHQQIEGHIAIPYQTSRNPFPALPDYAVPSTVPGQLVRANNGHTRQRHLFFGYDVRLA